MTQTTLTTLATTDRGGIDRRTLIKRAAVAGAVAWSAPVILGSLASPAAATTGPAGTFVFQYQGSSASAAGAPVPPNTCPATCKCANATCTTGATTGCAFNVPPLAGGDATVFCNGITGVFTTPSPLVVALTTDAPCSISQTTTAVKFSVAPNCKITEVDARTQLIATSANRCSGPNNSLNADLTISGLGTSTLTVTPVAGRRWAFGTTGGTPITLKVVCT